MAANPREGGIFVTFRYYEKPSSRSKQLNLARRETSLSWIHSKEDAGYSSLWKNDWKHPHSITVRTPVRPAMDIGVMFESEGIRMYCDDSPFSGLYLKTERCASDLLIYAARAYVDLFLELPATDKIQLIQNLENTWRPRAWGYFHFHAAAKKTAV